MAARTAPTFFPRVAYRKSPAPVGKGGQKEKEGGTGEAEPQAVHSFNVT